ncbi:MAG: pyrimidine 5'-nucleotidase [Pseudomonadota bacterium]
MLNAAFEHVTEWVFDLDNTLYPRDARLFDQIEVRMRDFIMRTLEVTAEEASALRDSYWEAHGTTVAGLMKVHGIDPDPFLAEVHQIDLARLDPAPDLAERIAALPGRRIVYTNGSRRHAERVLEARGLTRAFDDVFGVEDADYHPKPHHRAFETVFTRAALKASAAAMFEDDSRNLAVPHAMGLTTVLVGPADGPEPHVDHVTEDLTDFLSQVV